jgi:ribonuclease HII
MHGPWAIGIDEVGRGPLAGPVVACGVVLDPSKPIAGLKDSKKLSAKAREELYEHIYQQALLVSLCEVDAARIDQINIYQATLFAMGQVLSDATQRLDIGEALIDGRDKIPTRVVIKQQAIIKGDSLVESIMAASIVAKVHRDRIMDSFDTIYPVYGFKNHKGYGTEMHMSALAQHGPCAIHRMTFASLNQGILL